MNPSDYQREADRTLCDQAKALKRMTAASTQVLHAAMGVTKEGGELLSLVEKWLFYGKKFEDFPANASGVPVELRSKIADELGDVMWYAAELCNAAGLNLGGVMKANLAKLRSRYPNAGWEADRAEDANRDRAAEAEAVEAPHEGTAAAPSRTKAFNDAVVAAKEKRAVLEAEASRHPCTCGLPVPEAADRDCPYHSLINALPTMKGYVAPHCDSDWGRAAVRQLVLDAAGRQELPAKFSSAEPHHRTDCPQCAEHARKLEEGAQSAKRDRHKEFRDARSAVAVLQLRAHGIGCCDRFADTSACGCLETATAADAERHRGAEACLAGGYAVEDPANTPNMGDGYGG